MQQQQLPQRKAFCKVGSMFTANELDVGGKVFVLLGTKYSLAENQPASQQPFPVKSRSRFNFVGKGNNQLVSVFVYYFIDSPGGNFLQLLQRDEKKRFAFFTAQGSPRGRQRLNKHSTESPALFRDGLLRSSSRGKAIKHKLSSRFRHQLSIGGTPADTRRTKHTESWGCTIKLNDLMLFPLIVAMFCSLSRKFFFSPSK